MKIELNGKRYYDKSLIYYCRYLIKRILTVRGKTATVNELWPIRMGGVQCSAHALR